MQTRFHLCDLEKRSRLPGTFAIGTLARGLALCVLLTTPLHAGALDVEAHIACHTKVEDVRWSHALWPEANPGDKPPLAELLPTSALRARVLDMRRMAATLEHRYGITVGPEALQAELNRIAAASRAPAQLRELYSALDNDPNMIAACVVWPALVQQELRRAFQWDKSLHQSVRLQAETARSVGDAQMTVRNIAYTRKDDLSQVVSDRPEGASEEIMVSDEDWTELLTRLDTTDESGAASSGKLRETGEAFEREKVLRRSDERLDVRVTTWPKQSFDAWWQSESAQSKTTIAPTIDQRLTLPIVTGHSEDLVKSGQLTNVPTGRTRHTAIWTGNEMIVWGGRDKSGRFLATGGRYEPAIDHWTPTTLLNVPEGRVWHRAIWTGVEMIVIGGSKPCGWLCPPPLIPTPESGGRYNPMLDEWELTATAGAPRTYGHSAVWTGTDMIVWGGMGEGLYHHSGHRYSPDSNLWSSLSSVGEPGTYYGHTAVWTGSEMIVWGGTAGGGPTMSAGRYDPDIDAWSEIALNGAPDARIDHSVVWTGSEMIVWGGSAGGQDAASGGRYDPANDTWLPLPLENAPTQRSNHTAVWTGAEMIVWGGDSSIGGRYSPGSDSWSPTSGIDAPSQRTRHTAVWTGDEMIVWGGESANSLGPHPVVGGRYSPDTDSWQWTNNRIFANGFEMPKQP